MMRTEALQAPQAVARLLAAPSTARWRFRSPGGARLVATWEALPKDADPALR
jgi:hypothetical protein